MGLAPGENYLVYGQAESVVVGNGDYNDNGVVDAADYTIWHDTLGLLVDLRADGDGDLDVDQDDYTFWKDRFGNVVGTGSGLRFPSRQPACCLRQAWWACFGGESAVRAD